MHALLDTFPGTELGQPSTHCGAGAEIRFVVGTTFQVPGKGCIGNMPHVLNIIQNCDTDWSVSFLITEQFIQ
jgi:hypothetical protein